MTLRKNSFSDFSLQPPCPPSDTVPHSPIKPQLMGEQCREPPDISQSVNTAYSTPIPLLPPFNTGTMQLKSPYVNKKFIFS